MTCPSAEIALACDLLCAGQGRPLPLAEVARRCGYADPSHFGREFRRAWGRPPAQ